MRISLGSGLLCEVPPQYNTRWLIFLVCSLHWSHLTNCGLSLMVLDLGMCVLRECSCQINVYQDTQVLTVMEENSKKWNQSLEHFSKTELFSRTRLQQGPKRFPGLQRCENNFVL